MYVTVTLEQLEITEQKLSIQLQLIYTYLITLIYVVYIATVQWVTKPCSQALSSRSAGRREPRVFSRNVV